MIPFHGSTPMPAGPPLDVAEVARLVEGDPVVVIWTGGNGPHRYVITTPNGPAGDRYVWDGKDERLRRYNPLRFVGTESYHTRVWRAPDGG